jgi:hypothetical protein
MKRSSFIIVAVTLVGLTGLVLIAAKFSSKPPNVSLAMTPTTAQVLVDGHQAKVRDRKTYIAPGKHVVTASQLGFSNYKQSVTITSDTTLTIVLAPVTSEGFAFLNNNPSEILNREAVIGKATTDSGVSFQKKNPVTALLPYIDQYFRIDYGASLAHPSDDSEVGIYITVLQPTGKERALALLKQKGFDPNSLEIIYR